MPPPPTRIPSLATLLEARRAELLRRWTEEVKRHFAPGPLSRAELEDHIPEFLGELVADLRHYEATGEAEPPQGNVISFAREHGKQRFRAGFDLDAVTREYGALSDLVLELAAEAGPPFPLREWKVIGQRFTHAVAEAVRQYSQEREQQVRQGREMLQAIIDHAPAAIYVKDEQGRYLLINRLFKSLFHVGQREVAGKTDHDLFPRAMADIFRANDLKVLQHQATLEVEEVAPHEDGPRTYLSLKFPLPAAEGVPAAVCGISTDVTEKKAVEEERAANQRLQQMLLGIAGHDIRSPLMTIMASAAYLQDRGDLLPAQMKPVKRIVSSAERIQGLVSTLLDYTRARLGHGLPVTPSSICLHEIGGKVLDEMQAAHPDRKLRCDALGDTCGDWDPARLMQLIQNLLENALKYSPKESPVTLGYRGVDGEVVLTVHNEGPPIAPELLPYLFEPFRQGTQPSAMETGSMGLGLYIVREIVAAHGGSIEVSSTEAEGTTFTVKLPRCPPR